MNQLVLIPTEFERCRIVAALRDCGDRAADDFQLCGFGPIAAAARTAALIARHQPRQVLLVGIAGALSNRVNIGQAYTFSSVRCDGIGVGEGDTFRSAAELGWAQLDASDGRVGQIGDCIEGLVADSTLQLLTVCAASENEFAAQRRQHRYPTADAEEMEGFGVALSCRLASLPLTIIRGISNRAGNRDLETWKTDEAIAAVAKTLAANSR